MAVFACCALLAAAGWLALRLLRVAWDSLEPAGTAASFEGLVVACAFTVLGVTSAWLSLTLALALLAEGAGSLTPLAARAADVLAPRVVRLLARGVCGAIVATPLAAAPAGAGELPVPDRPDTASGLVAPALNRPSAPPSVVVGTGDCLWSIAAAHLPPDASAARIAAAWPRWYAANRARIGPDPDLIRPGTRLRAPTELRDASDRPLADRPTTEEQR